MKRHLLLVALFFAVVPARSQMEIDEYDALLAACGTPDKQIELSANERQVTFRDVTFDLFRTAPGAAWSTQRYIQLDLQPGARKLPVDQLLPCVKSAKVMVTPEDTPRAAHFLEGLTAVAVFAVVISLAKMRSERRNKREAANISSVGKRNS